MNKYIKSLCVICSMFTLIIFASCRNNFMQSDSDVIKVKLNISKEGINSRSVFNPAAEITEFTNIKLYGAKTNEEQTLLGEWTSISNAEVELLAAKWNFTLVVSNSYISYIDELKDFDVCYSTKILPFVLTINDITGISGNGTLSVDLFVMNDEFYNPIRKVTATVYDKTGTNIVYAAQEIVCVDTEGVSLLKYSYSNNTIANGSYKIVFDVYIDSACNCKLFSISEYANVIAGKVTKGKITVDENDFNYTKDSGERIMLVNYKPYNAVLIDNPSVTLPEYVIVPDSGNITINLPIESDFEPMQDRPFKGWSYDLQDSEIYGNVNTETLTVNAGTSKSITLVPAFAQTITFNPSDFVEGATRFSNSSNSGGINFSIPGYTTSTVGWKQYKKEGVFVTYTMPDNSMYFYVFKQMPDGSIKEGTILSFDNLRYGNINGNTVWFFILEKTDEYNDDCVSVECKTVSNYGTGRSEYKILVTPVKPGKIILQVFREYNSYEEYLVTVDGNLDLSLEPVINSSYGLQGFFDSSETELTLTSDMTIAKRITNNSSVYKTINLNGYSINFVYDYYNSYEEFSDNNIEGNEIRDSCAFINKGKLKFINGSVIGTTYGFNDTRVMLDNYGSLILDNVNVRYLFNATPSQYARYPEKASVAIVNRDGGYLRMNGGSIIATTNNSHGMGGIDNRNALLLLGVDYTGSAEETTDNYPNMQQGDFVADRTTMTKINICGGFSVLSDESVYGVKNRMTVVKDSLHFNEDGRNQYLSTERTTPRIPIFNASVIVSSEGLATGLLNRDGQIGTITGNTYVSVKVESDSYQSFGSAKASAFKNDFYYYNKIPTVELPYDLRTDLGGSVNTDINDNPQFTIDNTPDKITIQKICAGAVFKVETVTYKPDINNINDCTIVENEGTFEPALVSPKGTGNI